MFLKILLRSIGASFTLTPNEHQRPHETLINDEIYTQNDNILRVLIPTTADYQKKKHYQH